MKLLMNSLQIACIGISENDSQGLPQESPKTPTPRNVCLVACRVTKLRLGDEAMKNIDWPATFFVVALLSLGLFASNAYAGGNWKGKGTWHPTLDMSEVTVMINWMADGVLVPCGKDKPKARACAFPPNKSDIPRKGKLCEITHPGFSSSPTDRELETFGKLFETCLEQMKTRIITLRFKHGSNVAVKPQRRPADVARLKVGRVSGP